MMNQIQSLIEQIRHELHLQLGIGLDDLTNSTHYPYSTYTTTIPTPTNSFLSPFLSFLDRLLHPRLHLPLSLFLLYLILPILIPIVVALIAATTSLSAWLFWLFVGAVFGILQLLFVVYNFIMIFWDVGVLTVLKTFAVLRSFVRYYTYKVMGQDGYGKGGSGGSGKKRRRKEWREEVDRATTFKEFSEIEIYEPAVSSNAGGNASGAFPSSPSKLKLSPSSSILKPGLRRRNTTNGLNALTPQKDTASRNEGQLSTSLHSQHSQPETSSKYKLSPNSLLKKSQSCLSLEQMSPSRRNSQKSQSKSVSTTNNLSNYNSYSNYIINSPLFSWRKGNSGVRRNYSSNSLPNSGQSNSRIHKAISFENDGRSGHNENRHPASQLKHTNSDTDNQTLDVGDGIGHIDGIEDDERWHAIVEEDLGMAGNMLLTTMASLREARMKASCMGDDDNDEHDEPEQDETGSPDETEAEMRKVNAGNANDTKENEDSNGCSNDNSSNANGGSTNHFDASQSKPTPQSPPQTTSRKPRNNPKSRNSLTNEDYQSSLKFLLSGIVKRNHLSVDDFLISNARSIEERGQHSLRKETREAIDMYGEELERCLDWVSSGPVWLGGNSGGSGGNGGVDEAKAGPECVISPMPSTDSSYSGKEATGNVTCSANNANSSNNKPSNNINNVSNSITPESIMQRQREELSKRYTLVKRMKQNMGRTALMLSGGGAQAMYHMGTIKALVESELYEHIHVISGTSGGSIIAAMCAIKTPPELLRDICVKTVACDYMLTGEMERQNIRWFPSLFDMGANWMRTGLLADSKEFKRCCDFYYKDITFEEAFEMTGKHVCISVSASRASSKSGVQRLLLNHISTPNVTLSSAVVASCSLPGFMAPSKLMIKDSRGKQVPFEVDGVEWIDGSVQADLPFKRISTLFNISNFVAAQVNFHVLPFLNKAHHPNINTLYWKLFQMCMWDVRSRVLNLSQLGLFPRIFGQDITKVFEQKYFGNLTLVPRFTTLQLVGLKILGNPTVEDMERYLQHGQIAAWPFLNVIKEMLRTERAIDASLAKLQQRLHSVDAGPKPTMADDDVDSLSSALGAAHRAHLPGLGREAELLREKVHDLEQENMQLRRQVLRLQRSLGFFPGIHTSVDNDDSVTFKDKRGGVAKKLEGRFVSVPLVEEEDVFDEDHNPSEEKKVV